MARPRFAKLPQAQQHAILRAALDEFAAHGFHDASLNRIIDAAGISKGSMYYYFDGKEDLFAHVTRVEFERLFAAVGPVALPAAPGPDAFWSAVESYYLDITTKLPPARSWRRWCADGSQRPTTLPSSGRKQEMEQEILPWIDRVLAAGQASGAVRTDLPSGLLIAVAVGMGRAMDTWLMTQQPDDNALPPLISALVGDAPQSPSALRTQQERRARGTSLDPWHGLVVLQP